jgi:hypothetical protein
LRRLSPWLKTRTCGPRSWDIAARSGLAVEDVARSLQAIDGEDAGIQIAWSWHGGQEGMTDGHG